jgi:hypothetical protein
MPMGPSSSRFTISFTHYLDRAFAFSEGRSSLMENTFSASFPMGLLEDFLRGSPMSQGPLQLQLAQH